MYAVTAGWRRADGSRARHYVCPNVRGATGVCDAPRVDAGAVEPFFVAPLHDFLVDLDAGIAARAAQTDRDRELFAKGVQEQRAELARLGRRAEAACAQHDRLLDQGDDELADAALRKVARIELESDSLARTLAQAEERLSQWQTPDVDAVLDLYNELRMGVRGHRQRRDGARVNERLREVLDWVEFDPAIDGAGRRPELPPGAVRVRAYLSAAFLAVRVDPDRWAVAEAVVGRPSPQH
jgi:hypothetical protein